MGTRHPPFRRAGFTLVELLVAIAVLAIILVAAATILSTTASLTTVNNKHMDANDQARAVFDCMADDFARMVRRKDVDYLFWKNTPAATPPLGVNDAMYFYTEGASYFDSATSFGSGYSTVGYTYPELEKNSVSLVGYRVNNLGATSTDYNQLERLGKALSWDTEGYNATQPAALNSKQPNMMVFLTYDPVGFDPYNAAATGQKDPTGVKTYSNAFFTSTLAGAYADNATTSLGFGVNATPSTVGTQNGNYSNSKDTSYRSVGTQVFRFEYAFQLKDGTYSDKPVMTPTAANGLPNSFFSATASSSRHPLPTDDSSADSPADIGNNSTANYAVGSRWWDPTNHIGYICLDATPNYAVWREIGIQDVAAIIVTIAVIDKQGLVFVNANSGNLANVAAQLPDYSAATATPSAANASLTGNPAYLLDPTQTTGWAYALLPGKGVSTAVIGATTLPLPMISQIRLYQRYFYLNTF